MSLWRIRTEVDDRPGRLAALSRALADVGGNILTLGVQLDGTGVVDEFIVETPPGVSGEGVRTALHIAGGRGVVVGPANRRDLVDEPTRALLLAARLAVDPRGVPELLAELLRADRGEWGTEGDLVVPVQPGRSVALHRTPPFTLTEAARAEAFVRLLLPEVGAARETVTLTDGTRLPVRPLHPGDLLTVQALHRRCSSDTRRARYFVARRHLTSRMWQAFSDQGWGVSFVVEAEGNSVALAHLAYTPEPGVAELALLIEDAWQGRGLGRALVALLVAEAKDRSLVELRASLLADNARMRRLLLARGATLSYGGAVVEARLALSGRASAPVS